MSAPGVFNGRTVQIRGKVLNVLPEPFWGYRVFVITDETGEATVITKLSMPALNDEVALRGRVLFSGIVGDVPIEETERLR